MTYTGPNRVLYQEAVRIVPAVAAARLRGSRDDLLAIYQGFIDDCEASDVPEGCAWTLLAAAMSVWTTRQFVYQAEMEGRDVADVIADAVEAAQSWVDSGAV